MTGRRERLRRAPLWSRGNVGLAGHYFLGDTCVWGAKQLELSPPPPPSTTSWVLTHRSASYVHTRGFKNALQNEGTPTKMGPSTLILWVSSLVPFVLATQHHGLVVSTHQGPVQGSLVFPTVRAFLGVPYAVADRWQAPQSPPYRHGVTFNATQFGDSCIQTLSPFNREKLNLWGLDDLDVNQSEDCLTVNVWTPSMNRKQRGAVVVFVHGGGFQYGTVCSTICFIVFLFGLSPELQSNTAYYDGANLVRDNIDVVFVSLNYRLGIFGFPNAPYLFSETKSQNFGLLDIEAAIQWVHDNIGAFGGDPGRIILVGYGAGGGAIDAYSYANRDVKFIKGPYILDPRSCSFVLISI